MADDAGREDAGRDSRASGLSADPPEADRGPAFSDEGMRRIVHGQDRDRRSQAFSDDTAELEADLKGRRGLVPVVIAAAALLCFGAVVWYAYSWGTGQVASDQLPLVEAQSGPEKSRPDQPGGLEVPHQDKLVLNNGEGSAETPVVERLLPPPETPSPPAPLSPPAAAETATLPSPPTEPSEAPAADDMAPAVPAIPAIPESSATAEAAPEAVAEEPPAAAESQPEVALPQLKPAMREAAGEDQIARLLEAQPLETANGDPATLAAVPQSGDIVLQLSSVKSEDAAAREWARLQAAHPALLGSRALSTETAEVKGSTYVRVQTGPFPSRVAASEVCAQLKSRNQDCLVKRR